MALGRRICGPRWVVLPYDPALDDIKSDFDGYRESLFDIGKVVVRPGEQPSRFKISPLTEKQKRVARAHDTGSHEFAELVFRCGILEVDNYPVQSDDGSTVDPSPPDRLDRGALGESATVEWLNSSRIAHSDIEVLAAMIWRLSEARPLISTASAKRAGPGES